MASQTQAGVDLWLLRGVPTHLSEAAVVFGLKELGVPKPALWYVPGIRKAHQQNRGYAFIGFAPGSSDFWAMYEIVKEGRSTWQLQMEKSTVSEQRMTNNLQLWDTPTFLQHSYHQPQVHDMEFQMHPRKLSDLDYLLGSRGKQGNNFQEHPMLPYSFISISDVISL
eukprot:gb/GFBE01064908.1/.p1 GENE.gb/GFBE01064908.1/~~gb/GFBE01064908.1/.p1  ORF type:complete len:167 (+),score=26.88 gb/GFBE01064908.1/:1-501(+)